LKVKSGRTGKKQGLTKFFRLYPEAEPKVIASEGVPTKDFSPAIFLL
jgi:hypothetical protein